MEASERVSKQRVSEGTSEEESGTASKCTGQ